MLRQVACSAVAVALAMSAAPAWAGSGAMFGESSRAASLATAVTSRGGEPSCITMNPGALADLSEPVLALGAHAGRLGLSYARSGEPREDASRTIAGFGAMLATPLFGPWPLSALRFGVAVHVPAQHALRLRAPSRPDTPQFPLYEGRAERTALALALSWSLFGRIGIGAGVTLTPRLLTPTVVSYVPGRGATADENVVVDLERELRIEAAATLGIWARVNRYLALGMGYRQAVRTGAEGPNDTKAGSLVLDDRIDFYDFLEPDELTAGATVYPKSGTSISLDIAYARWSRYRTIHNRVPDSPFSDIVSMRAGIEHRVLPMLALRAGYAFEPTPVPEQTGVNNLLDAPRHLIALGGGVDLRQRGIAPMRIDAHARAHVVHPIHATKEVQRLGDALPDEPGVQIDNLGHPEISGRAFYVEGGLTVTIHLARGGS
jgi:long-chain fatty acid transport protein